MVNENYESYESYEIEKEKNFVLAELERTDIEGVQVVYFTYTLSYAENTLTVKGYREFHNIHDFTTFCKDKDKGKEEYRKGAYLIIKLDEYASILHTVCL